MRQFFFSFFLFLKSLEPGLAPSGCCHCGPDFPCRIPKQCVTVAVRVTRWVITSRTLLHQIQPSVNFLNGRGVMHCILMRENTLSDSHVTTAAQPWNMYSTAHGLCAIQHPLTAQQTCIKVQCTRFLLYIPEHRITGYGLWAHRIEESLQRQVVSCAAAMWCPNLKWFLVLQLAGAASSHSRAEVKLLHVRLHKRPPGTLKYTEWRLRKNVMSQRLVNFLETN